VKAILAGVWLWAGAVAGFGATPSAPLPAEPGTGRTVLGCINRIPPETPEARAARLKQVAARRAGTPILVHRGATRFAPENTLDAYAAAMDHGADGVEIDIRRSKDGVLYLFHDPTLERMTSCSGNVSERSYVELLQCRLTGGSAASTRIPTLAALLVLARQRAMLLHLDVKEPDLQDAIERLLDEAEVWEHIVEVNAGNAERLRAHPKVKLLRYKGWLPQGGREPDRPAIARFLAQPGDMVFCKDDPVWAVEALGRTRPQAVPLSPEFFTRWPLPTPAPP
jgi:hypothetical protein